MPFIFLSSWDCYFTERPQNQLCIIETFYGLKMKYSKFKEPNLNYISKMEGKKGTIMPNFKIDNTDFKVNF